MTLLGLRFWSPVTVVQRLGTMTFGFLPALVMGGLSLGSSILGGLKKRSAAKHAEDQDYQQQVERNNAMIARARASMGRSKYIGSLLKAYGMDKILGPDYFSDQNIMSRHLANMGFNQATRHSAGGPGWLSILGDAGMSGAAAYFGSKADAANPNGGGGYGGGFAGYTPNDGHVFDSASTGGTGGTGGTSVLGGDQGFRPSSAFPGNFGTGPTFGSGGAFGSDEEEKIR